MFNGIVGAFIPGTLHSNKSADETGCSVFNGSYVLFKTRVGVFFHI